MATAGLLGILTPSLSLTTIALMVSLFQSDLDNRILSINIYLILVHIENAYKASEARLTTKLLTVYT